MQKYFNVLKSCPLFFGIDDDRDALLACLGGKISNFEKHQPVFCEGDKATHIGIVLSGSVQITRTDYYGNRSILATAEPGELFAEAFACAEVHEIPVDVTANEPTAVLLIDYTRIAHPCSNACDFHRKLIYNLMKIVAAKNLAFHQKLEIISKRTTREKLMAYLLTQAKKAASNSFTIPFDRQALADYLQVDRSGLSAEISKLRYEKVLKSRRNHFELLQNTRA